MASRVLKRTSENPDAHLAFGQLDVDAHHDGNQITASMSVRSVVTCRSSARITTINSPSTVTPTVIKNSRRCSGATSRGPRTTV